MSKISVIIPIHNSGKYLEKCLRSIVNQSFSNLEIILIDDGSLDESLLICRDFEKKDNRIKVICQKQLGVSAARNIGIKTSTGEYVLFVDSDDWIEQDAIELMYNSMLSNKSDICFCGVAISFNGNIVRLIEENLNGLCNYPWDLSKVILSEKYNYSKGYLTRDNVSGYIWRCMFKNSIIKTHNLFFPEKVQFSEDRIFLLNYLNKVRCASLVNKYLYYYRKDSTESLTYLHSKKYNPNFYRERIMVLDFLEEAISESTMMLEPDKRRLIVYLRFKLALEILLNNMKLNKKDFFRIIRKDLNKKVISNLFCKESFKIMKTLNYSFRKRLMFKLIKQRQWAILYYLLKNE